MSKQQKTFFITGTGTEVGKTVITAGIAALCIKYGFKTGVMKPVQTGIPEYAADLVTISELVSGLFELPEEVAMPYCFKSPASPHLAAIEEGSIVDPNKIKQAYVKASGFDLDFLLLEGAGGINVPLNESYLTRELIQELKCPVILTALAGLGTINHTLLTVESLKNHGVEVAGIIINQMPLEPSLIEKDNVVIIEQLTQVPILGVVNSFAGAVDQSGLINEFEKQTRLKELLFC